MTCEAFKIHCHSATNTRTAKPLAINTVRQRLRLVQVFFVRIIEWGYSDAPARNPVIHGDVPPRPEPLPKFLDDASMARFMHEATVEGPAAEAVRAAVGPHRHESQELCNLAPDPVVQIGEHHWLHVPVESSATTATSPCTPTWSSSSPPGRPTTAPTSPATAGSKRLTVRSAAWRSDQGLRCGAKGAKGENWASLNAAELEIEE